MAITGSNVAIIQVIGQQGIELTYNTLYYYPTTGTGDDSVVDVLDGWIAACQSDWLSAVSEKWEMLEVHCSHKINGVYYDDVDFIRVAGSIVGDVLPAWTTYSFVKIPDNANREPVGGRELRKGRIAVAGVAENTQNNGVADPLHVSLLNALASSLLSFQAAGAGSTFTMYLEGGPTLTDPNEVFAPLLDLTFNRIGTQLTRKR